ncbi:MAG TPA: hypothetical protein VGS62_10600 [Streptosporangiaceae bacterium]|nr:hypothetical protein [Streptosporangiaceae bacterium]
MSERGGSSGSDPIGDFQRWLMRKSAQGLGDQIKGQARRTFSGNKPRVDVWEAATTEPPAGTEAPECAWCPICRAARRLRDSGPGLASQVAGAGDALFSVAQDALAAFDATLASSAKPPQPRSRPPEPGRTEDPDTPASPERHEGDPPADSAGSAGDRAARQGPAMGADEPDEGH